MQVYRCSWLLLLATFAVLAAATTKETKTAAKWMQKAYHELEFNSGLNDRCALYADIWRLASKETTDDDDDSQATIDRWIVETLQRVKDTGRITKTYEPGEEARGEFISMARTLDPISMDPMLWLDLFYCISEWAELDERAKQFVGSSPDV